MGNRRLALTHARDRSGRQIKVQVLTVIQLVAQTRANLLTLQIYIPDSISKVLNRMKFLDYLCKHIISPTYDWLCS